MYTKWGYMYSSWLDSFSRSRLVLKRLNLPYFHNYFLSISAQSTIDAWQDDSEGTNIWNLNGWSCEFHIFSCFMMRQRYYTKIWMFQTEKSWGDNTDNAMLRILNRIKRWLKQAILQSHVYTPGWHGVYRRVFHIGGYLNSEYIRLRERKTTCCFSNERASVCRGVCPHGE